jgi:hypothetical protein
MGQKPTFRFWHKADLLIAARNVRYGGKADNRPDIRKCPLMTQSEHWLASRLPF